MPGEPVTGQPGGGSEGAGFFEQVGGAGYYGQLILAPQPGPGLAVEAGHDIVAPADDEQRGRPHGAEARAGAAQGEGATRPG